LEITAQILGIIAIIISVLSMLFNAKKYVILFGIIYNVLTLISYLLLGKYLGCILLVILTLKNIVYYIYSLKKLKPNLFILICFEIVILVVSIILWQSWVDIFILINSLINTYTSWQDNVKLLKIGVVICTIFLVLYDVFIGAYVYVISELLYGGTALFSLIFSKKLNKEKTYLEEEILKVDE